MRATLRYAPAVALPLALFGALLYPAYIGGWYAMRELFRLSISLGVLKPTGAYWGQIQGLNIPAHSDAFHTLVRSCSLGVTFAPLAGVCLLAWYRLRIARPWGVRRWITLRRVVIVTLLASVAIALCENAIERSVSHWAFQAGKHAGCEYIAISVLWVGPDGPFVGGRWAVLFNPLYTHGHLVLTHTAAFVGCWVGFAWLSRRDPRPRRGQCPRCAYDLQRLSRCPECGRTAG